MPGTGVSADGPASRSPMATGPSRATIVVRVAAGTRTGYAARCAPCMKEPMARTYTLEPFDLDFFDTAPVSYRIDVNLPVTPARAWAELTRQNTLDWCKAIKSIEFTSAAPYGIGTTRRAQLAPGYATLSEYFFDWTEDPSQDHYRNAFRVESVNVPGMRRFGELTEVRPAEIGCRLIWAFGLELATAAPVAKAMNAFSGPASVPVFKSIEADTLRHFSTLSPQS